MTDAAGHGFQIMNGMGPIIMVLDYNNSYSAGIGAG